jgi:hypothetical protein
MLTHGDDQLASQAVRGVAARRDRPMAVFMGVKDFAQRRKGERF